MILPHESWRLYFLVEPRATTHIKERSQKQDERIEKLGTPSHGEAATQIEHDITDETYIEEEGNEFDDEGRARVTRTWDATEENEARNEQSRTHTQHA